jgi:hypothetical protein
MRKPQAVPAGGNELAIRSVQTRRSADLAIYKPATWVVDRRNALARKPGCLGQDRIDRIGACVFVSGRWRNGVEIRQFVDDEFHISRRRGVVIHGVIQVWVLSVAEASHVGPESDLNRPLCD